MLQISNNFAIKVPNSKCNICREHKMTQTCEAWMMWSLSELCFHICRVKENHKTNHCKNRPTAIKHHLQSHHIQESSKNEWCIFNYIADKMTINQVKQSWLTSINESPKVRTTGTHYWHLCLRSQWLTTDIASDDSWSSTLLYILNNLLSSMPSYLLGNVNSSHWLKMPTDGLEFTS